MSDRIDQLLDRALKIRPGEATKVSLMALYSASAIGAVVVGRTARDTLFLADRSKDDLPLMYILNSVAVALLSWGYSRFADRMRRDRLNVMVAAGWALVMVAFYFGVVLAPKAASAALYVGVEAMGSLVVIQFWTFAQDVFNAREAKRLFGIIGAGGQLANVIYGVLASGLSKRFGVESLLFLCAANLLACGALAWYVGRKYPAAAPPQTKPRAAAAGGAATKSGPGLKALATPHLMAIAGIAVLSALAVNLVDYQFKAAAERSITDRRELGAYFGQFYAICGALALAIQMGVTGRMLERFGVLASLLPLPIGLVLGSVFAMVWPHRWVTSLAKGSDSIFRYTLNDASMQLLYVPVPQHLRGRAKALIDGILKPFAGVAAGLLLVVLGHKANLGTAEVGSPDTITTGLIVLLVAGWIFLLLRGRREYVQSLLDTLQRRRLDLHSTGLRTDQATTDALAKVLRSDDALAILHAMELLQHVRGRDFGPLVAELLDHRVSSIRAAATDHFSEHADTRYADKIRERLKDRDPWCVASAIGALCAIEKERALPVVKPFLSDPRPAIRAAAVVGLVRHAGINGILEAAEELKRQLNAENVIERELAANILGALGIPTFYDALYRFLEDPNPAVRRAALLAAGRLKSPELVPHLVRNLDRTDTAREAAIALAAFGPGIEESLGKAMASVEFGLETRRLIPAVLGRIGSKDAADRLQAALESSDPPLRAAAARALARVMRRRQDVAVKRETVTKALLAELAHAEQLIDVQRGLELPSTDRHQQVKTARVEGARDLLALALREERDRCIERAIILLQLLYPAAGLDVVADNLRSDSPARRANAVEVIDNTVRDELKKRLLPLLEDRTMRPVIVPRSAEDWVNELLFGPHAWIAACAAQYALERNLSGSVSALARGLSSPTGYVRESCVHALARLAPEKAGDLLLPLKDDPVPAVRRAAEDALLLTRLASA